MRCSKLLQYGSHTTPRGAFQIFGGDSGDLLFRWLSLGVESGVTSCFTFHVLSAHYSWYGYSSKCSYSTLGYSMIQWSILPSFWNLNYFNLEPSCNLCLRLGSHDMYARIRTHMYLYLPDLSRSKHCYLPSGGIKRIGGALWHDSCMFECFQQTGWLGSKAATASSTRTSYLLSWVNYSGSWHHHQKVVW